MLKQFRRTLNRLGLSLTEVMIAMAVFGVFAFYASTMIVQSARQNVNLRVQGDLQRSLEEIVRLLADPSAIRKSFINSDSGENNACLWSCITGQGNEECRTGVPRCSKTDDDGNAPVFSLLHPHETDVIPYGVTGPKRIAGWWDTTAAAALDLIHIDAKGVRLLPSALGGTIPAEGAIALSIRMRPVCPGNASTCQQASSIQLQYSFEAVFEDSYVDTFNRPLIKAA